MSKLTNHITLFCSHDNTGYLVKYIDPVLGLDQNYFSPWTGSKLIHLTLSSDLFVWDVISNPPIRTALYRFQVRPRILIQSSASPLTWSIYADLKSSPVIVGFEIFLKRRLSAHMTFGLDCSMRMYYLSLFQLYKWYSPTCFCSYMQIIRALQWQKQQPRHWQQ
jgi:hypothetical protein